MTVALIRTRFYFAFYLSPSLPPRPFYLFLSSPSVPVSRGKTCAIQGRMQDCYSSQYGGVVGPCSADLTVILVVTESIHHSEASNAKHILPQPDQSQASWTTKCPVMPYFDHIIGEQLRLTKHSSDIFFPSLPASLSFFLPVSLGCKKTQRGVVINCVGYRVLSWLESFWVELMVGKFLLEYSRLFRDTKTTHKGGRNQWP